MLMKLRGRRGQGMTEYIIIVALIAIAAIGVISLFGDNIRALFATSGNALAGNEEAISVTNEAEAELYDHKGLANFGEENEPKI
jgi:pilus assembly protein Flp/PilA